MSVNNQALRETSILKQTLITLVIKENVTRLINAIFHFNFIRYKIILYCSNAVKKINQLKVTLFLLVNMILIPGGVVHSEVLPVTGPVKWHPGHYYLIMSFGKDKSWYMDQVYRELKSTPALRGLQIRFLWSELEKSEGVYDFAAIDQHLSKLAVRQRRLVIQVQTKSFNPDWKLIPDYLKTPKYEGGQFAFNSYNNSTVNGYNIKLWNPQVRDRLIALFRELGKRYNSHPFFEGVGMIETALGNPVDPLSTTQIEGFYDNLLSVHQHMRLYFPNTMTIQEVNYPRPELESIIGGLKNMGTALSGPDILIEEPGLLFEGSKYSPKGIYPYYPEVAGTIPIAPQVMGSNYVNTRADGTGYQPTVTELLAFARDRLKSNYIFWLRDPKYYPQVLEMLNWNAQKNDLTGAGGLSSTCPTTFSSCIN